ncbi:Coenzyme F420 hydrogenase/dehydrogenase, beta subunit C-terminal domain [Rhizobium sp. LCM 4573]|uniref:Coenzyme F420 hydrogenase/dehydrogenase, beta subunit C-terminal domain n=1 Tax=Rhizobium sp. LCM 4573 TaxID=1848291 RepID=UPI0008D92642|nr:Coenzyme F420 hydrogenase/dehydrogenase, beta subunit C-terminal domain [Rhizobium sp. LCM 4573]OHV77350.1 coenzyme F420 hydrogenase [Rhizobium sp. LCM 4573]
MTFDRYGQLKPSGSAAWLRQPSREFSAICPFSPTADDEDELALRHFPAAAHKNPLLGRYETAFVGHVEEADYRTNGSSGGLVTWVAKELLIRGMVDGVAHVTENMNPQANEPLFRYTLSRTLADLRAGAKSRYYPVELSGVLDEIRKTPGRYAVIGIPCFIKAVRLSCAAEPLLKERISFTFGLFCGHMKSARMAESFAWQMHRDLREAEHFDYRAKSPDRPANWYRAQMTLTDGSTAALDWWHMADGDWGAGFFQNPACNFCDDVVAETADIAFGDAWQEPYSSDGRGTNVIIVRSPSLLRLIQAGIDAQQLSLVPVEPSFIIATQAAGFRQRREGLSFRLTWPRLGIRPRKRVVPGSHALSVQRKTIYTMRYAISHWSHRVFWLARWLKWPQLYFAWARVALASYHGLVYSRGKLGRLLAGIGFGDFESRR